MKPVFIEAIALPLAVAASASVEGVKLADMPAVLANVASMECEYPSGTECTENEFCQLETGNCMLRIASQPGVCAEKPQMCPYDYTPVCGCDGMTYGNSCGAAAAGVNVMTEGECPTVPPNKDCSYPDGTECDADEFCDIGPGVCGTLDPGMSVGPGTCTEKPQMCTADYNPVCGCDGKTYSNKCSAHAAGVIANSTGACPGDYCAGDGNFTCWTAGVPQCCLEEDQPCPSDRVPRCDFGPPGWDYCAWQPNEECYPSNGGHPECCSRFDGTNCPPQQPKCENHAEVSIKFLRG